MTVLPHRAVDQRRLVWPLAAGFAALLGLAAAPVGMDGPTVCPFALITGHACPGCGMTRAVVALAHGDVALAWSYHPLAWLVALQAVVAYGWWLAWRAGRVRRRPGRWVSVALGITAAALVAVWLARLTAGTLPPV